MTGPPRGGGTVGGVKVEIATTLTPAIVDAVERLGGTIVRVDRDEWWQTMLRERVDGADLFVHPVLNEAYVGGRIVPLPAATMRRHIRRHHVAALSRDEVAVLQFLQEELD